MCASGSRDVDLGISLPGEVSRVHPNARGLLHASSRSGPVEIVKVGAELASEDGASALLQFAAIISVNLAVINALPVPGLDGGQMVFIIAEAISRRKIDR